MCLHCTKIDIPVFNVCRRCHHKKMNKQVKTCSFAFHNKNEKNAIIKMASFVLYAVLQCAVNILFIEVFAIKSVV